jgi:uncharacterized protein YcbX
MPTTGGIAETWRYPLKPMAGQHLERAAMDAHGIAGDGGWALRAPWTEKPPPFLASPNHHGPNQLNCYIPGEATASPR